MFNINYDRMDTKNNKKIPSKSVPFDVTDDLILADEATGLVKEFRLQDIEQTPEVRHLLGKSIENQAERLKILESLNNLPPEEVRQLFKDYIEQHFDLYLQTFFDKLYKGIMSTTRHSLGARLNQVEDAIADLKASVLMAHVNPYGWIETSLVQSVVQFLSTQPNCSAPLHSIYKQLTYREGLPVPGHTLTEKYEYLLRIIRKTECFREYEGFLIELLAFEVVQEGANYATADSYRETLSRAFRNMDSKAPEKEEDG